MFFYFLQITFLTHSIVSNQGTHFSVNEGQDWAHDDKLRGFVIALIGLKQMAWRQGDPAFEDWITSSEWGLSFTHQQKALFNMACVQNRLPIYMVLSPPKPGFTEVGFKGGHGMAPLTISLCDAPVKHLLAS